MNEVETAVWHCTGLGSLHAHQGDPRRPWWEERGCTIRAGQSFILQAWGGHSHCLFLSSQPLAQEVRQVTRGKRFPTAPHVGSLEVHSRCSADLPCLPFPPGIKPGQALQTEPSNTSPTVSGPGSSWTGHWGEPVSLSPARAICSISGLCNASLGPGEQLGSSSGDRAPGLLALPQR